VPPPVPVVSGAPAFMQTFGSLNINADVDDEFLVPGCNNAAENSEVTMVLTRGISINSLSVIHNMASGNGEDVDYQMYTGNPLAAVFGPVLTLPSGAIGDVVAVAVGPFAVAAGTRLGVRAQKALSIGNGNVDAVFTIGGEFT